jgi:L-asparaginase II
VPHVPLIATTRGKLRECLHAGSVAVVDLAGALVAGTGELRAPQFSRSTLKPFQALPFVREGGMDRWRFGSQELALLCASHNGETVHARIAARILSRVGAGASDLQCGCHEPYYYAAARVSPPRERAFSPLQHNCSGKHAGFLAMARLLGEAPARYLDREAGVQSRVRALVRELAPGDRIGEGTDGCSAPNFALPLARLAHLYARLAADPAPGFRALFFAMTRHPDLVSGTARFDLAMARAGAGDWVAKVGADGVQCIGVRSRGIGIAVRVLDGSPRAAQVAAVEVMHRMGLLPDPPSGPLAPWFRPAIRSLRGQVTGETIPVFQLR